MESHLHETELLNDIARRAGKARTTNDLLLDVVDVVAHIFEAQIVAFWLPDPIEPQLVLIASQGLPPEGRLQSWHLDDDGIVATVNRIGVTFFSNDIYGDERLKHADVMRSWGIQRMIAVPIISQEQVVGVMCLARTTDQLFPELQLAVAKAVASQIGLAVAEIKLTDKLTRQTHLTEHITRIGSNLTTLVNLDKIYEYTVQAVHQELAYEAVSLWLRDGPELIPHARAINQQVITVSDPTTRQPITVGIVGRTVRTGRSYVSRDLREDRDYIAFPDENTIFHSAVTVPLLSDQHVVGALVVMSSEIAHFDEIDKLALEALAAQVAIALENTRLYEQAHRRLREQQLLFQIGNELNSIYDHSMLINIIPFFMAAALDTTGCILLHHDSEINCLVVDSVHVSRNARYPEALSNIPETSKLSGLTSVRPLLHSGTPLSFAIDDEISTSDEDRDRLERYRQQSALAVPLSAGGRSLGLLLWTEDRTPRRFAENEVRMAQMLANQAAIMLDHTRLHDDTQNQLRRESTLRQVAETANTWSNRAKMYDQFARQVNRAMETDVCSIYTLEDDQLVLQSRYQASTDPNQALPTTETLSLDTYEALLSALEDGAVFSFAIEKETPISLPEQTRVKEMGYHGMLIAPLVYRDRLVGALELLVQEEGHRFTIDEITLLESLVNPLSTAVDNVRMYQEEFKQRILLQGIQQASQSVSEELNEVPLLELIVERLFGVFDADAAFILINDDDSEDFHIGTSRGLSEKFVEDFVMQMDRLYELHGEDLHTVYFDDVAGVATVMQDVLNREGVKSVLSIPLVHGQSILGVMGIATKGRHAEFSRHEQEMAQLLGRQVAIALNNARLFELQEERAAELALANRLKNEFLANISHELRTPMNSIIGFTQGLLAGMHGDLTEKQHARLSVVERNAQHLLQVIDDLIDLANIEANRVDLEFSTFDPREIIMVIATEFMPGAEEKGLAFRYQIEEDTPMIWSDAGRLRQVFRNLVSNAIKFTSEGAVTIEAGAVERDETAYVHFKVTDTGVGIAPENLQIIFDAFRQADGSMTRKYEGTGMGLAISHRLIDLMHGTIEVESTVGEGSIFHIWIPTAESDHNS